jgi:hypothetical protein
MNEIVIQHKGIIKAISYIMANGLWVLWCGNPRVLLLYELKDMNFGWDVDSCSCREKN